jgi:hypothetical protein
LTWPTAQEYEDGTVIIRNADGFDLALHPVGKVEPSPAFLHAGFKVAEPAGARALMERMDADGVTIVERNDEAAYVAFKCLDPDGHRIEVPALEPRPRRRRPRRVQRSRRAEDPAGRAGRLVPVGQVAVVLHPSCQPLLDAP